MHYILVVGGYSSEQGGAHRKVELLALVPSQVPVPEKLKDLPLFNPTEIYNAQGGMLQRGTNWIEN